VSHRHTVAAIPGPCLPHTATLQFLDKRGPMKPPGTLFHLDLARIHPKYRGLDEAALRSALRIDLTFVALDRLVAVSWALAGGGRHPTEGVEPLSERHDVALEVVGRPGIVAVADEEIEQCGGDSQLPLVRLTRPTED